MEETQVKFDQDLIAELERLIKNGTVNRATIAKGINKSDAAISQYLSQKYPGNIEKMEVELRNYINLLNKKEQIEIKAFNFVETSVVKKLSAIANYCQLRGKMGACIGAPGIGKTTAINEYKKMVSSVIVVDPLEQTRSRAVLSQICDQLKLNYHLNTSYEEFTTMIAKKLEKNKYLLIIDEAENIRVETLRIIRKIHDRAKNSCGVLLVGTHELQNSLDRLKNGLQYISSRIAYTEKLDLLNIDDIKKLVIQYFPNIDEKLLKYIANTVRFNTRYLQNLLDICYDITKKANIALSCEVVDLAKEHLFI